MLHEPGVEKRIREIYQNICSAVFLCVFVIGLFGLITGSVMGGIALLVYISVTYGKLAAVASVCGVLFGIILNKTYLYVRWGSPRAKIARERKAHHRLQQNMKTLTREVVEARLSLSPEANSGELALTNQGGELSGADIVQR